MKLVFSEAPPDYNNYVFPFVVWGFPEPSETAKHCWDAGFLPSLPDLSRFYLCRHLRVVLSQFKPSSENRRILRRGHDLTLTIIPRSEFEWTHAHHEFCLGYAKARWSSPPSPERIERIFSTALTTHVACAYDSKRMLQGIVTLCQDGGSWLYTNAFYALDSAPGLGAFLMTEMVRRLCQEQQEYLYLGTCYSRSALYKTAFAGTEFFNGIGWQSDLSQLKELLARQEAAPTGHLLEDEDFLTRWVPDGLTNVASASPWTNSVAP